MPNSRVCGAVLAAFVVSSSSGLSAIKLEAKSGAAQQKSDVRSDGTASGGKVPALTSSGQELSHSFNSDRGGKLSFGRGSVPWLRVEGNWLVDELGKKVKLRGVGTYELGHNWTEAPQTIDKLSDTQSKGWHANVIRLPIRQESWNRLGPDQFYQEKLKPAVDQCVKERVYCIIDLHGWVKGDIWHPDNNRNPKWVMEFWNYVAPKFNNVPNIMYEVYNEPLGPKERTLNLWLEWRRDAQPWVDQIRSMAPNTVILIGSPRFSSLVNWVDSHPFKGKNLVYVYHVYPRNNNLSLRHMRNTAGQASKKVPIFATEFGWDPELSSHAEGTTSKVGKKFKKFFQSHPQINWTVWAYGPGAPLSIVDKKGKVRGGEASGEFIRQWIKEENRK